MKIKELIRKLEGVQTIQSVMSLLNVDKKKAVYYIYRLRKKSYVKTSRLSDKRRVYKISFENKLGGFSYYDIINKYSPVKVSPIGSYKIYGENSSPEGALIFALKTRSLRTISASLALFKKITDWVSLYRLAKRNHLEREVGALYDLARTIMKTRKMPKRFRTNALPREGFKYEYIIKNMKSKDFEEIEKIWHIYIPFNKSDLEAYR